MPKRDAKLLKVLIGQMAEDRNINVVLGKALRVLGHAERCQPLLDRKHMHLLAKLDAGGPGQHSGALAFLSSKLPFPLADRREPAHKTMQISARLFSHLNQPAICCIGLAAIVG
jgi:hypothetical protein